MAVQIFQSAHDCALSVEADENGGSSRAEKFINVSTLNDSTRMLYLTATGNYLSVICRDQSSKFLSSLNFHIFRKRCSQESVSLATTRYERELRLGTCLISPFSRTTTSKRQLS